MSLSRRESELLVMLKRITHVAICLDATHHAGDMVTPEMWSALHSISNECRGMINQITQRTATMEAADDGRA
jgi:hypothetical protein